MNRSLSFGSDAAAYHRHRPGYPDAVADLAVARAEGPVRRALEIGAGTGHATVVFAGRGIDVVAVEPDPEMRAVLSDQVAGLDGVVRLVDSTFETTDLDEVGPVDLVYAAAAFHWTDPATRWARVTTALRPGGALALFGSARDLADETVRDEVDRLVETELGGDDEVPGRWTLDDVTALGAFTDVEEVLVERSVTLTADEYVAHLTTVSAYRVLPEDHRADLLRRVRSLLPDRVEVREDVVLHLARRR